MWVTLNRYGYRAVLKATTLDEAIWDELQLEVREVSQERLAINAPYVAWFETRRMLADRVFGPRGGKRHQMDSAFTAMRKIVRELNYIDSHPALQGMAMLGGMIDIIPAWKVEPSKMHPNKYSPYPQPGKPFVILTPTYLEGRGSKPKMTWWVERTSGEGRFADEQVHLRLYRHPVR